LNSSGELSHGLSYIPREIDSYSLFNTFILPSFSNLCKISITKAKIMNNEKGINFESVYDYHEKNKYRFLEGWMARYIGEILLNIDDQHVFEAEEWIKKTIEADRRNDMRWHLGKAIDILTKCGADGWVDKYEKELASAS
jgi:hypothetical protein